MTVTQSLRHIALQRYSVEKAPMLLNELKAATKAVTDQFQKDYWTKHHVLRDRRIEELLAMWPKSFPKMKVEIKASSVTLRDSEATLHTAILGVVMRMKQEKIGTRRVYIPSRREKCWGSSIDEEWCTATELVEKVRTWLETRTP
jgi:hypothetical protein